ncbi:MAG: TerC/Alx family metal homeostasis membrane protein [Chitinophagaceae bacterium]|nr:TerC/Alx family metal homeostasis membrane protein [Chitinophagaceae bacterium]
MTKDQITILVFLTVLLASVVADLELLSRKSHKITIRQALYQTFFWVGLALSFFVFMWIENGQKPALEYLSAYLMEWSLSVDNIFVFIIIFSAFSVKEKHYGRVLLLGILMAILFRVIFITVGVVLVERFSWILYLFGVILIYTGYKMYKKTEEEEFNPHQSKVYQFLKRYLPLVPHDGDGRYIIRENGKPAYTTLFVVVVMLAAVDLVFAVDSIPAVMGIVDTQTESYRPMARLVIYTSNIFAVLGLRSLFFLLRSAVSRFDYLQQGIAIILVFIGIKMLTAHWLDRWIDKHTQIFISLGVILTCISGSIFYSIFMQKKGAPRDITDESVKPD